MGNSTNARTRRAALGLGLSLKFNAVLLVTLGNVELYCRLYNDRNSHSAEQGQAMYSIAYSEKAVVSASQRQLYYKLLPGGRISFCIFFKFEIVKPYIFIAASC